MRSRKQTERQQLLMESSLAYPRAKEGNRKTQGEKKTKGGIHTRVPRGRESRHIYRRCAPEGTTSPGSEPLLENYDHIEPEVSPAESARIYSVKWVSSISIFSIIEAIKCFIKI
ncbi:hypothetical protein AVEN_236427-1 [Araneus ventricosus]|uniref:Uncharacterized protein n=1 Tax=Araneus ventricosus TaxID=182803 RepID=A0A4Y2IUA1_ARAVE|nr:hypothetical protein AVEN_236427-1 [Araneus ventricosus]